MLNELRNALVILGDPVHDCFVSLHVVGNRAHLLGAPSPKLRMVQFVRGHETHVSKGPRVERYEGEPQILIRPVASPINVKSDRQLKKIKKLPFVHWKKLPLAC